mgnify:CR=1 FL=1
MEDIKQQVAGHPVSERFDQIDPALTPPPPNPGDSAAGGFPEGKSKKK